MTQTIARSHQQPGGQHQRSQIAMPAQGIIEMRDALIELLHLYADESMLGRIHTSNTSTIQYIKLLLPYT